jgi:hypothetical protein
MCSVIGKLVFSAWLLKFSIFQGHEQDRLQLQSSGNNTSGNTQTPETGAHDLPGNPGHLSAAQGNHIITGQSETCMCAHAALQLEEDNSNQSGLPGNLQPLPGNHSRSQSLLHHPDDASVCNLSKPCPVSTTTTSCLDDVNGNPKNGSNSSNVNRMQPISGQSHDRLQNARPNQQSQGKDAKRTQDRNSVGGVINLPNSNSTQGVCKSYSYDSSGYAQVNNGPLGGSMVRQPDGNVRC